MHDHVRTFGAIALVVAVVASGCLTISTGSTVNNDGTIERYETRMEMPTTLLDQMNQSAQEENMTLEESIKAGYDEEAYGSIEVTVEEEDDQGIITIVLEDFDPDEIDGSDFGGGGDGQDQAGQSSDPQIDVTVEEDRVVYVDDSFDSDEEINDTEGEDEEFSGQFSLEYTLTMPGPVVEEETNADEIDGRTATWERTGSDVFSNTSIRAVSVTNEPPSAAFSVDPEEPSTGQEVEFDASESTDPDGDDVTYEWDFNGDGEVNATGETVTHTFEDADEHNVTLRVTDQYDATDAETRTVSVPSSGFLGMPGFGVGLALLAVLLLVGVAAARRR
ncbi:hypothetical protein BRD00_12215 [Halobacteriales archaeon QS_8_69_26]|nr:MAG: hypothetical protein BRD00_12215 [Halobacteriales archaeon QS_8_69_26]